MEGILEESTPQSQVVYLPTSFWYTLDLTNENEPLIDVLYS